MPMIGARTVDPKGAAVLYEWIASMEEKQPIEPGTETIEAALRAAHLIRTGEVEGERAVALIKAGKASANPMISALFDGVE